MKLSRIKIENYRSIKLLDFRPSDLVALIGENNTGKTNILRARNIILGETWPSERSFSEEDFYNKDTDQSIKISIWFDEPISYDRYGLAVEIRGFSLEYKKYVRGQKKGEYHTEFQAIDENGESVKVLKEPFSKGKRAQFIPCLFQVI
jgi:predicted ATP-dependent endonuclease of OLD family